MSEGKKSTRSLSGPQCAVEIKNLSEGRCTEMWIWFNHHNVTLLFLFFLLESSSTLEKLTYFLAWEQLFLFTQNAKTNPLLTPSIFASIQTNWVKGTIDAIDGRFCWKLYDSCLWPEATVQEKLSSTPSVPGAARTGFLKKRMGMKSWMWACKELLWQGYYIKKEITCLFIMDNEWHLNPLTQGSPIKRSPALWDLEQKHLISSAS